MKVNVSAKTHRVQMPVGLINRICSLQNKLHSDHLHVYE